MYLKCYEKHHIRPTLALVTSHARARAHTHTHTQVQRDHIETADKTVTQQNAQLVASGEQQVSLLLVVLLVVDEGTGCT